MAAAFRANVEAVGKVIIAAALLAAAVSPAAGQRRTAASAGVYKSRISPNWFDGGARFWYRNDLSGKREFVLVDVERGQRERAFDHQKLADALAAAGIKDASADRLPIDALEFKTEERSLHFRADNRLWKCDLATYQLTEPRDKRLPASESPPVASAPPRNVPRQSRTTGAETEITFVNRTAAEVEIFWLDLGGTRQSYGKLAPGGSRNQHTYAGHVWEAVSAEGRTLNTFLAEEAAATAIVDGRPAAEAAPTARSESGNGRRFSARSDRSPDGKWVALIKDGNLVIRATEGDREMQLSQDGREGLAYGMQQWSPDSKTVVAFRIKLAPRKDVHFVESSPRAGGRAVLHTRPYALPGDDFTLYEPRLFSVEKQGPIECHVEAIDFGTPRIRWSKDGSTFSYQKVDRGHQRLRLIEIDARTGASRTLIDEKSETFVWTAHAESVSSRPFNWLENSDEIIYASERDGWRHLYLVDAREGAIRNQITTGQYVVRGIDRIDEENRQVWFQASGRNADQDPYFIHHYRINFDGSGLVALTAGNGNHSVQYSPDAKSLIDTYSRVGQPPVHELRRTSDGQLLCRLEEADITELKASGWEAPEVFTAKGRDGQTDIWGIICRPKNFDPTKKYPIIESIYAGPHGSHVPKAFSSQRRFSSLTDLGFVVVQMDGMGTANRSKAFHDVCWRNLKDAGLPDRILWHQAAAARYPWYDTSRVGIYGTSAGGQNSTGAMLFHPDFYKVCVSACGCHDNRMDKASWNEQWMGYPVGSHYAESSNIDNALRLKGKLLLIVGEMDTNVPPESTFRLADALIKAGKDFDLVVVPGAGHGMGGAYGSRRMQDFFVRHLLGANPPDRNGAAQ